jgi:diguanylate cyclase (GGDEF)-like protein
MRFAERFIKHRSYWLIAVGIWTAITLFSAGWNLNALQDHAYMMARERGKNFFRVILLTRQWNSDYGPVYVPISGRTPPNPHLHVPNRELMTDTGLELTMINPAYMTRQISEIADKEKVYFHLTSLRPLRPENKADKWEKEALQSFHRGATEKVEMLRQNGENIFRYMAPLFVKESCLACHASQGYKVGDIRGGLSVNLDADEIMQSLSKQQIFIIIVHSAAWVIVSLLLLTFLNSTRKHTIFLEGVNYAKQKDLQRQKSQLEEHNKAMQDLVTRDTTTGVHTAEHFKQLSTLSWNNAITNGTPISILLLEVDHFKDYNNNYGALEGDFCLKQITEAITRNSSDKGSIVARYGGASFVIMLTGMNAGEAFDVADKIHGGVIGMAIPHETSEISKYVTITGVISTIRPKHGDSLTQFVRKLTQCLNRQTDIERNRIHKC